MFYSVFFCPSFFYVCFFALPLEGNRGGGGPVWTAFFPYSLSYLIHSSSSENKEAGPFIFFQRMYCCETLFITSCSVETAKTAGKGTGCGSLGGGGSFMCMDELSLRVIITLALGLT